MSPLNKREDSLPQSQELLRLMTDHTVLLFAIWNGTVTADQANGGIVVAGKWHPVTLDMFGCPCLSDEVIRAITTAIGVCSQSNRSGDSTGPFCSKQQVDPTSPGVFSEALRASDELNK